MSGPQDLGGRPGFGPVGPDPDEAVFHHDWERRVFALVLAAGAHGRWNLDQSRQARERLPEAEYHAAGYFGRWLDGLEDLLDRKGLVSREELEARRLDPASVPQPPAPGPLRVLKAEDVDRALRNPRAAKSDADVAPRFREGDRVRARRPEPRGHTRLPGYCLGKTGVVVVDHGVWVFPDSNAAGEGPRPQHVYAVRFGAVELWGPGASPRDTVVVDLWDDYLEAA